MVHVSDKMYIGRNDITTDLKEEIKEELTIPNKAYYNALKYSRYSTTRIPQNIYLYKEENNALIVPRAYGISKISNYVDETVENTVKYPKCLITLRELQSQAEKFYLHNTNNGLIVLNTGIGKSVLGIHLAYMLRQKTLIVVHKDDLVVGWKKDAKLVFGDDFKVGLIKAKKFDIGEQITIATIQTLNRLDAEKQKLIYDTFGCVIVDEVHRAGSQQYDLINNFKGAYRIGLTATLERNDEFCKNIYSMFGGVAFEYKVKKSEDILPVTVYMKKSKAYYMPKCSYANGRYKYVNYKDQWKYSHLKLTDICDIPYKERPNLNYHDIEDTTVTRLSYMAQVISDVITEVKYKKHKCLLVFNKKEHIDLYAEHLKKLGYDSYKYYGDSKDKRDVMLEKAEQSDITLATYGIATEGTNVKSWQTLFLVSSINNAKNTEQIVGRIRRTDGNKERAYVYDYCHTDVYGMARHHDTRRRRYVELGFLITTIDL